MSPRFAVGETVVVAEHQSAGHVRTPHYIKGKRGTIERICGAFRRPEELAYGRWEGTAVPLYRVRFDQREVWPDYAGAADDTLDLELYEPWLEADR